MRNIRQNPRAGLRLQRRRGADRGRRALSAVGILLSPIVGAAAMALSSVSVIGNALRLRAVKL
jgi:Cu+-exporting ATPase